MGYYEYLSSIDLEGQAHSLPGNPFYSLIMAAARCADTDNLALLIGAFPETVNDLRKRYNAPGGFLEGERPD